MADQVNHSPDDVSGTRPVKARGTRRRVIQSTVAVAGGLAAASYVTPTLRSLGIPVALAVSGGGPPPPPLQGCSPGYWKTHPNVWKGYSPSQTLASVFTLPSSFSSLGSDSLSTALSYSGGPNTIDKARLLLYQAVAALLNITAGLNYPTWTTTSALISAVNAALATQDSSTIIALQTTLDTDNNLACPLS